MKIAELNKKCGEYTAELVEAVKEKKDDKRLIEYFEFCSRFHYYSFQNRMLIWVHRPDATLVAGFKTWQEMGRSVKKGEKGIPIFAPMRIKGRKDQERNTEIGMEEIEGEGIGHQNQGGNNLRFKVVYVWDISQTDGDPLPESPDILSVEGEIGSLLSSLEAVVAGKGIMLEYVDTLPIADASGVSTGGAVKIIASMTEQEKFHVLAHELAAAIKVTSGPALTRPADLIGILTNLDEGDVLFIDEIHRLPAAVEEYIYPAMEEFKVDFVVDSGMHSRTINLPLKPFTLIGATTRAGLLSPPLRMRFGLTQHLDFWSEQDLLRRLKMSAQMLQIRHTAEALELMARRARGTPRIANRLLRRCRDYAQIKGDGQLTVETVNAALGLEGIDELGLDELDRSFLRVIIETYRGGPVGIEAVAATLGEETDTLVDVVEPFLLQIGFLARTRRGRRATIRAYRHLGLEPAGTDQQTGLFDNGQ